ncbi:hypothetical protein [Maridesulfovibrio hydrothermalis]|uniref:Uncharacterized protein n=1 Tax=Maridesulfovibrio hydrothermalis AM13 = DSM 14728 TaxID=1121451 RepID=L0RGP0_9BACT|nr:hypothetical protein [Maridesulfovibrio hydrothermalis]CCO25390.1 conserved protein of unknown function [Maridesulfovibrio hydrothermalis AM13 = DSM 14728]
MKENYLYDVLVREMVQVQDGAKCPEKAALSVMSEFAQESVYFSTRYLKHAGLAVKVAELKDYGVENSAIAERLGITKRHVRRLYASMKN